MFTNSPSQPEGPPPGADRALRSERHLRVLEELTEVGMEMVRALRDEAVAEDGKSAGELALTFSRVARAVRQTVALEARLAEGHEIMAFRARSAEPARAPRPVSPNQFRRTEIGRVVGEMIDLTIPDDDQREPFYEALYDRIDDVPAATFERPMGVMIAEICRDLGLEPDWSLWAEETFAIEEARDRTPGSPYADMGPPAEPAPPDGRDAAEATGPP